jgi:hypothetical protein
MKNIAIILCLFILSGCKTPSNPPPVSRFDVAVSRFDVAIENLSKTTQQLEDLRREKDFFAKSLADFEQQKTECGDFMDANEIDRQTRAFARWHWDIAQREKDLTIEYSMNVYAAHREMLKRKAGEPNQTASSMLHSRNP